MLAEAVEALLPVAPVVRQPIGGFLERTALEPGRPQLRATAAYDQPGSLEHLEVLGDRLEADRERLRQLVHRRLALGQPGQDRAARGIRQRRERRAELLGRHVLLIWK